jgi:hypothetical protein
VSVTGKLVPAAVLSTTVLRFATTGFYELTGSGNRKDRSRARPASASGCD